MSNEEKVIFEIEKKVDLGEVECPECSAVFKHVKIDVYPVSYEVKAPIRHTRNHPNDKTKVYVESKPYEVLRNQTQAYPKDSDELKTSLRKLMKKYNATAWIFGLGSDSPRRVENVEQIDGEVERALEYMRKYDFEPRWNK